MVVSHFVLVLLLTFIPLSFYRSGTKLPMWFFVRMAASNKFRQFTTLLLVVAICWFNMSFMFIKPNEWGSLVSLLVSLPLLKVERTISLLRRLRNNRKYLTYFFTFVLVIAFVPHCYPVAGTLAVLILGIVFFPSEKVEDKVTYAEINFVYPYVDTRFIDAYFS